MYITISCSRGGLKKRIKSAWYKKDVVMWLELLIKSSIMTIEDFENKTETFLRISSMWNNRDDIKHTEGNYPNWDPYCCNPETSCSVMHRMVREDYGWRCSECGNTIGKHLYRINLKYNVEVVSTYEELIKKRYICMKSVESRFVNVIKLPLPICKVNIV